MAAIVLPPVPGDRHRRRASRHAGRDPGALPHHQHGRRVRRHVGRPRRLRRHDRHGLGLCGCGKKARRGGDRAQQGRRTEAAAGSDLGPRHRERDDQRRARCQRRRTLGEAGWADGRTGTAGVPARTPLSHYRDNSRSRGAEGGNADGRRPRGLHLHAPGPEGNAGRDLRDPSSTLVDGRRALGLRGRASSGEHRPHLGGTRTRPSPVSGLAEGRHPQMGQWRIHLFPRREPTGRSGRGQAGVLARLRRDGRVPPGRRRRQSARRMDDPRGNRRGRLRPRHRPLRRPRVQSGVHPSDDRRVLRPPIRHDLPERAIAGGPSPQDNAGLRRHVGGGLPVGQFLGPGDSAVFRAARFQGKADPETLERLRHRRRGVPRGAQERGTSRYRGVLALRGDRTAGRKLARLADRRPPAEARTSEARADAFGDGPAQRRPHNHQLGRRNLLDRRLLLPAPVAYALVRRPRRARGRSFATFPTT